MAKNLSDVATIALSKVDEQTARQRKPSDRFGSDRITRKGIAAKTADGKELGPAILTGEGEIERKSRRAWLVGLVAVVAVAALLGWLFVDRSPQRQLLQEWGKAKAGVDWSYPYRFDAMRAQAAAGGSSMVIFTDLSNAEIGEEVEWLLDPVSELADQPLSWHGRAGCLVPTQHNQRFTEALAAADGNLQTAMDALRIDTEPFEVIDHARFAELAAEQGWPTEAQDFIWGALQRSADPQAGKLAVHVGTRLEGVWHSV